MRRQLNLQDYQIPSLYWNVTVGGMGARKQYGFNTDYKTHKVEIQTLIVNGNKESVSCQINEKIMAQEINAEKKGESNQNNKQQQQQNTQEQLTEEQGKKVDKFLRKVIPLMQKELNENLPLYKKMGTGDEKHYFKKETRLTYTLENLDSLSQDNKLIVSDVAWNSTGVMVAAVYAKAQHETACSHKSMICLWSMFKRNFKPTKPQVIYTNNCISCIQFHPKKPSVFAIGNYIGEILLYDLSKKNEQLIAKTLVDDYFHRDIISQICWWPFKLPGKSDINYNLLSLGTDGKILLWQVPTVCLGEDAPANRVKALLKYPIKGYSILRKKQGVIIPVSALSMKQSKQNRNIFVIGSEGGSILKASLTPINHYMNTEGKILLDMQQPQGTKYKKQVYPFLLNVPAKQFRELKQFIQKSAKTKKIDQIDSINTIYSLKPQLRHLYPNSITFAYEPLSYPIASLSINRYGLFIANGCDGYSRLYIENRKEHLESFEEGYEWGWINEGTKIAGFIGQQFAIVDWVTGNMLYSVPVGQALRWKQSGSNSIAVISENTKIKIVELGDRVSKQQDNFSQLLTSRINDLTSNMV